MIIIIFYISRFNHQMLQKNEKCTLFLRVRSPRWRSKSKDDKEKHLILSFEKLKPENVVHFYLRHGRNYFSIIRIVVHFLVE